MRFERHAAWVVALALVGACSQKDPDAGGTAGTGAGNAGNAGGGSTTAGTSAAGDGAAGSGNAGTMADAGSADASATTPEPDDFFPLIDGASFTYRHISPSKAPWDDKTTFSATTYEGMPAFLTEGSADPKGETSTNVFIRMGTKIQRVAQDVAVSGVPSGSTVYEPGFLRFDTAWVDEPVGFETTEDYRRIESDVGGTILADDNRSHTFTIESLDEAVDVPAGKLTGCMRVRRERVRAAGTTPSDDDDKRFWYCPGVGKAKELAVSTGATEELVSCTIPGRACP